MATPHPKTCRIALKEWGLIDEELRAGRQTILVRKGGILEAKAGFRPSHARFVVLPTRYHQGAEQLRDAVRDRIEHREPSPEPLEPGHRITVRTYLELVRAFWIADERKLDALEPWQVLDRTTLEQRFAYGDRPGLYALLVRAYALTQPQRIRYLARYGGCKSWVKLDDEIELSGADPVLSEADFEAAAGRLAATLGEAPSRVA